MEMQVCQWLNRLTAMVVLFIQGYVIKRVFTHKYI